MVGYDDEPEEVNRVDDESQLQSSDHSSFDNRKRR